MAFSQSVTGTVTVDLKNYNELLISKDKKIESFRTMVINKNKEITDLEFVIEKLEKNIDSLEWYKNYYKHSHHVLGKRLIGRIEEMVNHE